MLKVTSEAAYVLKAAREGVTTPTAGLRIMVTTEIAALSGNSPSGRPTSLAMKTDVSSRP